MRDEILKLLVGRRGHFQMESGYHSERWFNLDSLFERPERLRPFVAELARRLAVHRIDAVCGPTTGGAKLAQMISVELGIEYFFTERFEQPAATRLYPIKYLIPAARRDAVRGKLVALVDDAVSAGSAARGTHADLLACGARPVALGALFVFGDAAVRFSADHGLALENIAKRPLACGGPPIVRSARWASAWKKFPPWPDIRRASRHAGARRSSRLPGNNGSSITLSPVLKIGALTKVTH